jgi:hypothetical protein
VKFLRLFSLICLITSCAPKLIAQVNSGKDSTSTTSDSIQVKPNLEQTAAASQGNFIVLPKDQIGFQTYAGFNAINMLRGHAPNLTLNPNAGSPSGSAGSLLVIDGLPYSNTFGGYYNLNSFEYGNIYAFRSGNAGALYGGSAANGSVFLQSKTGENIAKPTFEFNSTTANSWSASQLTGDTEAWKQWLLVNSLAFQQDFGAMDTRVSYTFSAQPPDNSPTEAATKFHAVKINTGLNIGSRFTTRLILDHFQNPINFNQGYFVWGQPSTVQYYKHELLNKNTQGNLRLQYQITPWLALASQSALTRLKSKGSTELQSGPRSESNQRRAFVNFFVNTNHTVLENFRVKAFVGGQYEKQKLESELYTSTSSAGSKMERETKTLMGGAGLQFKNYLFANFDYRKDYLSTFGPDNNDAPTYSFNASFILSEAMKLDNSWLPYTKLRASLGNASIVPFQQYPDFPSYTGSFPNPSLRPSTRFMTEYGIDMLFMQEKLGANGNYFRTREEDMLAQSFIPGTTGGTTVWVNRGVLSTNGWEIILSVSPVKNSNFNWQTKFIWATYKTKIDLEGSSSGGGGSGTVIGSPNPDWRGSYLNQITWKGWFSSFLVDIRKGGDFITYEYDGNFPTIVLIDGTMARLRDFSMGYRIPMHSQVMQEIQVSLSGRNLWTIYSKIEDREGAGGDLTMVQKSLSLSISAMF